MIHKVQLLKVHKKYPFPLFREFLLSWRVDTASYVFWGQFQPRQQMHPIWGDYFCYKWQSSHRFVNNFPKLPCPKEQIQSLEVHQKSSNSKICSCQQGLIQTIICVLESFLLEMAKMPIDTLITVQKQSTKDLKFNHKNASNKPISQEM